MRAVCIDDEILLMQMTVDLCRELPWFDEVQGFTQTGEALSWLEKHPADIVLLDIDMPDMNGIRMAKVVKEQHPDTAIIFLTGYAQYAVDAFALHASGYLLKPISRERLASEIAYALDGKLPKGSRRVEVRTFGGFEVLADGKIISFHRAKAKELLAFLVERQGVGTPRAEIFATLWEEGLYDRSMQKQLDVIVRSLRETLQEYHIQDILVLEKGQLRILPEKLDCDLYRFLEGDADAINAYRGEYLSLYPWAGMTEAWLDRTKQNLNLRF